MTTWTDIVNIALVGTEKRLPTTVQPVTDTMLATLHNEILHSELDGEEQLLQLAALNLNYARCGQIMPDGSDTGDSLPDNEAGTYCTAATAALLGAMLPARQVGTGLGPPQPAADDTLLDLWLSLCVAKQYIAPPRHVPALLRLCMKSAARRRLVVRCMGTTGRWLCALNKEWQAIPVKTALPDWETGTVEERRQALLAARLQDPEVGRKMLMETWPTENAAGRAALLKVMATGISAADCGWIETLLGEKSQKVMHEVIELLKMIPGSSVLTLYEQALAAAIVYKKEKTFFGLGVKKSFSITGVALPERIYDTGIRKGDDKAGTAPGFELLQIVSQVSPDWWCRHFGLKPTEVIACMEKEPATQPLVGGLMQAAICWKHKAWLTDLLANSQWFDVGCLPLLDEEHRNRLIVQHYNKGEVMDYAADMGEEWSREVAIAALLFLSQHPHNLDTRKYKTLINLLPCSVAADLATMSAQNNQPWYYWQTHKENLLALLAKKAEVISAFAG